MPQVLRNAACFRTVGIAAALVGITAAAAHAAVPPGWLDAYIATKEGFVFGDFANSGAATFTAESIVIDAQDLDGEDGLLGGVGYDIPDTDLNVDDPNRIADFDFEVTFRVLENNAASTFQLQLEDQDGPLAGNEWRWDVDLTGLPVGTRTTVSQPLFVDPTDDDNDNGIATFQETILEDGETVQGGAPGPVNWIRQFGRVFDGDQSFERFELVKLSLQGDRTSSDRLHIEVESVKVVDRTSTDPAVADLVADDFQSDFSPALLPAANSFVQGEFADQAAATFSDGVIAIDAEPDPDNDNGDIFGALGKTTAIRDLDLSTMQLEVSARLGPNNAASGFLVALFDRDDPENTGDAVTNRGEQANYLVDTALLNADGFTTLTIALSDIFSIDEFNSEFMTGDGDVAAFFDSAAGTPQFDLASLRVHGLPGSNERLDVLIESIRLLDTPAAVPGDADGDGDVDAFDLGLWQTQFGMSGDGLSADFDNDGDVDAFDLGIWQINFGTGVGGAAVPEPATALLLLFGTAAPLLRRR